MPRNYERATPEQRDELMQAYQDHIVAVFEAGRILDVAGFSPNFAEADEKVNQAYIRLRRLISELDRH
jgi:hypothetical protein